MSKLMLRALSNAQVSWHQAQAGWRARGVAVSLALPPQKGTLVLVNADDGEWQALMDPREWLAQTAPALAAMAEAVCDVRQIMALFNSMPRPLTFSDGALDYRRLHALDTVAPMQCGSFPLPRLEAKEGHVWLKTLAPQCIKMPEPSIHGLLNVPLLVEFILGVSRLPARLTGTLAIGDILLISELTRRLICQGRPLGHFCQREDIIMIDENHDEIRDDFYEGYPLTTGDHPPSFDNSLGSAITALPLKVEFILQRRFMSVGEVQALFTGKVLELDPACEQKIELRSNGHLLARGELVQLEDRLGVEIMELYPDNSNA